MDENKLTMNKVDYISTNYSDIHVLMTYPLLSSVLLLTIIPFLSNGAYWLSLLFQQWRSVKKNEIEGKQLLTLEQSIALRKEMRSMEIDFEKLVEKKGSEIESLKKQIFELEERLKLEYNEPKPKQKKGSITKGTGATSYGSRDFDNFMGDKKASEFFEGIVREIRKSQQFPENIPDSIREYYLVNDIVEEKEDLPGKYYYELTFKGNGLYRDFFNLKFNDESKEKHVT
ncbi:MAG: hypothetical protein ABI855_16530 [Bacteroidota bacterium]